MSDTKFPTEIVDLPSKGYFYDKDSPLASGQIELKYLTAREEDILTSTNLIQKGLVIDKLLESLIVDRNIPFTDLLIGDKNAIMIASRILGYGKDYEARVTCRVCSHVNDVKIDLTSLDDVEIDEPETKGVNSFEFTLPMSKKVITFRLLTQGNEDEIDKEVANLKKLDAEIDRTLTTRLKHIITAIDGDEDPTKIRQFVDNELLVRESKAFRGHYQSVSPDINTQLEYCCSECDDTRRVALPIGMDFFWPDSEV